MIYCIVLAAGESARFPSNKLLYIYQDKPIILQTLSNIVNSRSVRDIIVVTGYQHEAIERIIKGSGIKAYVVYNPDYRKGMSYSIKVGVNYILEKLDMPCGIMINPGDVAWVHPGIYTLIAGKFLEDPHAHSIVVAAYRGRRGHPVIFSSKVINDLLSITEEKLGLKEVINKYRYDTLVVETEYPGVLLDLDNLLDLLRVKNNIYK
ncbi:MAG: nucleotidyltransferase family protein [Desulfurococcaceae archaeon]